MFRDYGVLKIEFIFVCIFKKHLCSPLSCFVNCASSRLQAITFLRSTISPSVFVITLVDSCKLSLEVCKCGSMVATANCTTFHEMSRVIKCSSNDCLATLILCPLALRQGTIFSTKC